MTKEGAILLPFEVKTYPLKPHKNIDGTYSHPGMTKSVYLLYGDRLGGGYQLIVQIGYIGKGKYEVIKYDSELFNGREYLSFTEFSDIDINLDGKDELFEQILKEQSVSAFDKSRNSNVTKTVMLEVFPSDEDISKPVREFEIKGKITWRIHREEPVYLKFALRDESEAKDIIDVYSINKAKVIELLPE